MGKRFFLGGGEAGNFSEEGQFFKHKPNSSLGHNYFRVQVDKIQLKGPLTVVQFSFLFLFEVHSKADPAPAHRARAPLCENFQGCIFESFASITRINFIVISMQCLQYVL